VILPLSRGCSRASAMGLCSSRQVQQAPIENVAFRVVDHNQTPDCCALNRFRPEDRVALGAYPMSRLVASNGVRPSSS
jgi:hypothetical protein